METSSYVGLSGALAFERRLAVIAHNVANAGTAGFRAEGMEFSTIVSRTAPFDTSFTSDGGPHVDTRSGAFVKTGNSLDVAIQGDGFIAIETPAGTVYTRDGRMQMQSTGELVSVNGHPILDSSGSPLTLNPAGGEIAVARDGTIRQAGRAAGAIGLYQIDLDKGYRRYENAGFIPAARPEAIVEFIRDGMVQGFVEQSNVNPILEMTRLIAVQRAFEAMSSGLERRDAMLRDTIQALGPRG